MEALVGRARRAVQEYDYEAAFGHTGFTGASIRIDPSAGSS